MGLFNKPLYGHKPDGQFQALRITMTRKAVEGKEGYLRVELTLQDGDTQVQNIFPQGEDIFTRSLISALGIEGEVKEEDILMPTAIPETYAVKLPKEGIPVWKVTTVKPEGTYRNWQLYAPALPTAQTQEDIS